MGSITSSLISGHELWSIKKLPETEDSRDIFIFDNNKTKHDAEDNIQLGAIYWFIPTSSQGLFHRS